MEEDQELRRLHIAEITLKIQDLELEISQRQQMLSAEANLQRTAQHQHMSNSTPPGNTRPEPPSYSYLQRNATSATSTNSIPQAQWNSNSTRVPQTSNFTPQHSVPPYVPPQQYTPDPEVSIHPRHNVVYRENRESGSSEVAALVQSLRAERQELPKFQGIPSDYLPFTRAIQRFCIVEQDPSVQFNKILNACDKDPSAFAMVNGCRLLPPKEGVEKALSRLKQRYGRPNIIVEDLLSKIHQGPNYTSEDDTRLLDYIYQVSSVKDTLLSLDSEVDTGEYSSNPCATGESFMLHANTPANIGRLIAKLPRSWQNSVFGHKTPTLIKLCEILETKIETITDPVYSYVTKLRKEQAAKRANRQAQASTVDSGKKFQERNVFATSFDKHSTDKCDYCERPKHQVINCKDFIELSSKSKFRFAKVRKLCFNCFSRTHRTDKCTVKSEPCVGNCPWRSPHSKYLCSAFDSSELSVNYVTNLSEFMDSDSEGEICGVSSEIPVTEGDSEETEIHDQVHSTVVAEGDVFLNLVAVEVLNPNSGLKFTTFAMLDPCASVDVVESDLHAKLQLETVKGQTGKISTVLGSSENASFHCTNIGVKGLTQSEHEIFHQAVVMDCRHFRKIRCPTKLDISRWPILNKVVPAKVDIPRVTMIISMKRPGLHVPKSVSIADHNGPAIVEYEIGFVAMGSCGSRSDQTDKLENPSEMAHYVDITPTPAPPYTIPQLSMISHDLWGVEDLASLYSPDKASSAREQLAQSTMMKSIKKVNGKTEVGVAWKSENPIFPDNFSQAVAALESLRRRFIRDPQYFEEYSSVIASHISAGHAELIPDSEIKTLQGKRNYLLHHGVRHPRKLKLRVVLNASKKCKGVSLNGLIEAPPSLLNKLIGLFLRFREMRVAVMGDIKGFYYDVFTPASEWDFSRFLWFLDNEVKGPVSHFRLKVHIFGGVASQAAAIIALHDTINEAVKNGLITEQEAELYIRSFYSDDFLSSFETSEDAINSTRKLTDVLKHRGFELLKFCSNSPEVNVALGSPEKCEVDLYDSETTALGITWNMSRDCLVYKYEDFVEPKTKRDTLSALMKLYDPPGLVAPYVLPIKLVTRDIVDSCLQWDDKLDEVQFSKVKQCFAALRLLVCVEIPRCISSPDLVTCVSRQLHVFSDGSTDAFGACAYIRSEDTSGYISSQLVMSKNKLTPRRGILTIPKIELLGAVTSVRLARTILDESKFTFDRICYWTDSLCVIGMIHNDTKRFQVFVSHRLAEIRACSETTEWRYVDTKINPADVLSRGRLLRSEKDVDKLWTMGPEFIRQSEVHWPHQPDNAVQSQSDIQSLTVNFVVVDMSSWYCKINSWFRVKYHAAVWLRLKSLLLNRVKRKKGLPQVPEKSGKITKDELEHAEECVLRCYQGEMFAEELDNLKNNRNLPSVSQLHSLNPIMVDGLLCVGGRLKHADVPLNMKHPIILPEHGHLIELLVDHTHKLVGHGSANHVLTVLRSKYWIVCAKRTVRSLVQKCKRCQRFTARHGEQFMANLPKERLALHEPPFTHTGVDLFGHFWTKRARSQIKRWAALFTCMTTRAVHIEKVDTLDMNSFIESFRRFTARRGTPETLTSDQGGNFIAADRELTDTISEWNDSGISHELLQKGTTWIFNPPRAPHFSGAIERLVGVVKSALRHSIDGKVPSDETFTTLLCEAESCVNSRPLTEFTPDPYDERPLTPYDILLLKPCRVLPPGVFTNEDCFTRKSYKAAQYYANVFWKRFIFEYLPYLQKRCKWLKQRRDFKISDLVLLVDENCKRGEWKLGRIVDVKRSDDGYVRSVKVKSSSGIFERPVSKVCLLEATKVD